MTSSSRSSTCMGDSTLGPVAAARQHLSASTVRSRAFNGWKLTHPTTFAACPLTARTIRLYLLLQLCTLQWAKPRFRFESFWVKLDGFDQTVAEAWNADIPGADPCRRLDVKLRNTARALQAWSMKNIGSVRSQLFMARELISQFDKAQERRTLTDDERALHSSLKVLSLGLSSLSRTICRQRSRIRFLAEGDANTRYFHLQACHTETAKTPYLQLCTAGHGSPPTKPRPT